MCRDPDWPTLLFPAVIEPAEQLAGKDVPLNIKT